MTNENEDISLREEALDSLRAAYNHNLKTFPERKFTRSVYRLVASELNLPYKSARIEELFDGWQNAISEIQEVNDQDAETVVTEEVMAEDEDTFPLLTKKNVTGTYKILVLPDIHIPYQCHKAVEAAIALGEKFKPDEVIQLGDLLDCYSLSHYPKTTLRSSNFAKEVEEAIALLKSIKERTGAKYATLLEGNHEARLRKYLLNSASSLKNLSALKINNLLNLASIGWDFIPEHKFYAVNDVFFTHGEFVNAHSAKKHMDEYRETIIHGHTHRITSRYHRGLNSTIEGWEMGCLASLEVGAEYVKRANWQHGVGTVVINGSDYWINCHHIRNGKVEYNGSILP